MLSGGQVPLTMIRNRYDRAGVTVVRRSPPDKALLKSLAADGQQVPVLLDARTYEIIDGQRRFDAAQELGWTDIRAVTVYDFTAIATFIRETREFEESHTFPYQTMLMSERVHIIGTLKRIKEIDDRSKRAENARHFLTGGKKKGEDRERFQDLMGPAWGLISANVDRLSNIASVLDRAPAPLSAEIEKVLADMDVHGSANKGQRLAYEARNRYHRVVVAGEKKVPTKEVMQRAERIISGLETIAYAIETLVREAKYSVEEDGTEEQAELVRRLRIAQRKIGTLTGLLVSQSKET